MNMKRLRPSLNNSLTFPYVAIILFAAFVLGCNSGSQDVTQSEESQAVPSAENPLFTELDAAEIGIDFFNELVLEEEHMNMVNYTNIFNGGGVAVGDINNDGLLDLYLTGSMVTNKLYLNIGDFKFKDITESAGVDGGEHGWCTGVTMVDINNDGYLDIYVCRAFNKENPELRENLLYVNNQDQTFTERAKEYGINDNGYANQATFLDYNLDGHIDLFIGNHPPKLLPELWIRVRSGRWRCK